MRERGPDGVDGRATTERLAAVTALTAFACYLVWRVGATMGTGAVWLAVPMLALELWGFALFSGLLFRAWPRTASRRREPTSTSTSSGSGDADSTDAATAEEISKVDVVVTAGVAKPEAVERTLIALAGNSLAADVTVIEGRRRDEIADLCERFQVGYRHDGGTTAPDSLLKVIGGHPPTGVVLWLDGGEIPLPGLIETGLELLADPDVAVVQVARQLQNGDSLVNLRRGGDPEVIEDKVFGPSLGHAGIAPWIGSGSFVRRVAFLAISPWPKADAAALHRAAIQMHRLGWRTVHSPRELLGVQAPTSLDEYLGYRRRKALAAYRFLVSAHSPLRLRGVGLRARAAHLADALAHTAGLRQLGIVVLVVAVLFSGQLPLEGSAAGFLSWWLPAWLLADDARRRIVRGLFRRGDGTRHAWRGLEAEVSAARAVLRPSKVYRHRSSLSTMRTPVLCVVALNLALLVRGVTFFVEGLLPPFSITARLIVFGLAVFILLPMLDVLQLTARRRQRRSSHRVRVSCPVTFDGQEGRSIDLTVNGMAVSGVEAEVGDKHRLSMNLPTGKRRAVVEVDGIVRSSFETPEGRRVGFQFADVSVQARQALVEFCLHAAARRSKGSRPVSQVADLQPVPPWRQAVQAMSLVGAAAGLSMMFAGPAAASGPPMVAGAICLVDSAGGPLAGAEAQYYNGAWFTLGATNESGCVEGEIPSKANSAFRVTYEGLRNQLAQDTTIDSRVVFSTVPVEVSLRDSGGGALSGGVVMFYGGSWQSFGVTGESGSVTRELLAQRTSFRVTYEGLRNQLAQDTTIDSRVVFSTVPVEVSLRDSGGGALSGGVVMFYGGSWQSFGVTGESGSVTRELLAQRTSFRMTHDGHHTNVAQDTLADRNVVFRTGAVVAYQNRVKEYWAGRWKPFTDGIELLPVTVRFRLHDRSQVTMTPVAGQTIVVRGGDVLEQEATTSTTASTSIEPTTSTTESTESTPTTGASTPEPTASTTTSTPREAETPPTSGRSTTTTSSATTAPSTTTSTTADVGAREDDFGNPELLIEPPSGGDAAPFVDSEPVEGNDQAAPEPFDAAAPDGDEPAQTNPGPMPESGAGADPGSLPPPELPPQPDESSFVSPDAYRGSNIVGQDPTVSDAVVEPLDPSDALDLRAGEPTGEQATLEATPNEAAARVVAADSPAPAANGVGIDVAFRINVTGPGSIFSFVWPVLACAFFILFLRGRRRARNTEAIPAGNAGADASADAQG